jgi:hypothetical protein
MPVVPAVYKIRGDEKAYNLLELHEMSPDHREMRRYQIIMVKRDGMLAEWRRDMGPARNYQGVQQLHIPSAWEYTVDELLALAEELRNEIKIDLKDWLELEDFKPG